LGDIIGIHLPAAYDEDSRVGLWGKRAEESAVDDQSLCLACTGRWLQYRPPALLLRVIPTCDLLIEDVADLLPGQPQGIARGILQFSSPSAVHRG
jgi:hypothetical protein